MLTPYKSMCDTSIADTCTQQYHTDGKCAPSHAHGHIETQKGPNIGAFLGLILGAQLGNNTPRVPCMAAKLSLRRGKIQAGYPGQGKIEGGYYREVWS